MTTVDAGIIVFLYWTRAVVVESVVDLIYSQVFSGV